MAIPGSHSYMSNDDHHYISSDEIDRDAALINRPRRNRRWSGNTIAICVLSLCAIAAVIAGIVLLVLRSSKDSNSPTKILGLSLKPVKHEAHTLNGGCIASRGVIEELDSFYKLGGISSYNDEEICKFMKFKHLETHYNRNYSDLKARHAGFLNYRRNMAIIDEHNKNDEATYTKGINHFFDMDVKELASKLLRPITVPSNFKNYESLDEVVITKDNREKYAMLKGHHKNISAIDIGTKVSFENINWRTAGVVSPVKDQGSCGSCWAFATIGAVESLFRLETKEYVTLSEQELVSCDSNNDGCSGGFSDKALDYIKTNGITSADNWKYAAVDGECTPHHGIKYYIRDYMSAKGASVASTLLVRSPTIVYVAFTDDLFHYSGGVFNGKCSDVELNHAVLLVGEGYDATVKKRYWLIKNSWGSDWGEDGFLRLERTGRAFDKCGILSYGFIPSGARLTH